MSIRPPAIRAAAFALALVVTHPAPSAHTAGPPARSPGTAGTRPATARIADAPIATVLGRGIGRNDLGPVPPMLAQIARGDTAKLAALRTQWEDQALAGLVLGAMLDRYGKQHAIVPTEAEVSEVLAVLSKIEAGPDSTLARAAAPDTTDPEVRGGAAALVGRFRIHAALHAEYGGRVFLDRQSGPLPFDAYRRLLEAEQKAGSFSLTPAWEKRFWAPLSEDAGRQFLPAEQAQAAISQPWWRDAGGAAAP